MRVSVSRGSVVALAVVLLVALPSCRSAGPVSLQWVSPADSAVISGAAVLELTGQGLVNVEVFEAGRLVSRAAVSPDGRRATATLDTTTMSDGRHTLTAHGWNSAAGTPFTSEADAGARSVTVANGDGEPPAPTTTTTTAATTTTVGTTTTTGPRPSPCGARPTIPAGPPLVGVYTGNDPQEIRAFEAWFGRPVDGILGYTGGASWADYDGSVGWAVGLWKPLDRPVLWSVPLIAKGASLEEAAAGGYNDHFRAAAQKIAAHRPQDRIVHVRTGWEFNGDWFPWAAKGRPEAFKGAFRQFVDTFRSVSDRFVFEWNVNVGDMGMDPETAYPGDCWVDIIGMDFYWNLQWDPREPDAAWQSMVDRRFGLRWHQDFAAARGKPTSYSEWGVGNANAGPYIHKARQWFIDRKVVFHSYWDSNVAYTGKLSNGQFGAAGDAYRQAFR